MVQELRVHTIGGVVTPAQPLLVLVPADSELEIEVMISNRDIGFVEEGQDVQIDNRLVTLTPGMGSPLRSKPAGAASSPTSSRRP